MPVTRKRPVVEFSNADAADRYAELEGTHAVVSRELPELGATWFYAVPAEMTRRDADNAIERLLVGHVWAVSAS
jgi:hypothetical protein